MQIVHSLSRPRGELWSWSGLAVLPPAGCHGQASENSSDLSGGSSSYWEGCDLGEVALCS